MRRTLAELYGELARAIGEEDTETAARLCRDTTHMLSPTLEARQLEEAMVGAEQSLAAARQFRRSCLGALHQVQRAQEYCVASE